MELYKKHRPTTFKEVVGQDAICKMMEAKLKEGNFPHATLFTGPSGCGKTTLARIAKTRLKCSDLDYCEMNCADFRGIDSIREIRARMGLSPMGGTCRIWLVDECHKLTNDSQNALLKMLEDTPNHVYFMLCTTDPAKLLKTILTRCTEYRVQSLAPKKIFQVLVNTLVKEHGSEGDRYLGEKVAERLIEVADGSARRALVLMEQILTLEEEDDQIEALEKADVRRQAIELARALINPRCKWPEVAAIIKGLDEEPETLRYMILGYATNVLLGGGKLAARAYLLISIFRDNWYDSKKAGLAASCYEVFHAK